MEGKSKMYWAIFLVVAFVVGGFFYFQMTHQQELEAGGKVERPEFSINKDEKGTTSILSTKLGYKFDVSDKWDVVVQKGLSVTEKVKSNPDVPFAGLVFTVIDTPLSASEYLNKFFHLPKDTELKIEKKPSLFVNGTEVSTFLYDDKNAYWPSEGDGLYYFFFVPYKGLNVVVQSGSISRDRIQEAYSEAQGVITQILSK